ncbi:MAG: WYL domain-containing transcriptional regulator [Bacteroidota bacterium]|nr:WYL domain-containing transcriptional regulator [Bacteroidota bacterium]
MPKNKQALLRYQIIDACLSNRYHVSNAGNIAGYWPCISLAERISEELGMPVAARTIRKDISDLKNGVLGIPVPIANKRGMGYHYTEKGFHLFNMRLNQHEAFHLSEAVHHIDHLMTHQYFRQLSGCLKKLNYTTIAEEDMVLSLQPYNNPPAYTWLKKVVEAIESRQVMLMEYQPYSPPAQLKIEVHPYLIKEFNQRLYMLGWDNTRQEYFVFGLDRIKALKIIDKPWHSAPDGIKKSYFKDIVGVSLPRHFKVEKVKIEMHKNRLLYVLSKPLHQSQRFVSKNGEWGLLEFDLVVNRDLKQWILEKGKDARVIAPEHLKHEIITEIMTAQKHYKH